jgi:hypothetical protein
MGKSTFAIRIYLTVEDSLDIEQSRRLGVNLECHAASEIRGNVEPALLGKQSFYICRTSACRSGMKRRAEAETLILPSSGLWCSYLSVWVSLGYLRRIEAELSLIYPPVQPALCGR